MLLIYVYNKKDYCSFLLNERKMINECVNVFILLNVLLLYLWLPVIPGIEGFAIFTKETVFPF